MTRKQMDNDVFTRRMKKYDDEMRWLYMELYDNSSMYAELCDRMKSFFDERQKDLKKRDEQREIDKDSFNLPFVPTLEYVQERNKTVSVPKNLWERIHRGGYPALQDSEMDWGMFFSSYVKTYLERDVRKLTAVQDLNDFRRFMVAVAARTGQMVNYSNIADEIGKDQSTVKAWMSILEASGVPAVSRNQSLPIVSNGLQVSSSGVFLTNAIVYHPFIIVSVGFQPT